MENSYGIGVKNRYELFYNDEEDPLEILRQQEEERERKKVEKLQKDKGSKGAGKASSGKPAAVSPPVKKSATKENVPVRTQEAPGPKKEDGIRPRGPKPSGERDRMVKFQQSPRDDQKEVEERKNRRNRDGPPTSPSEFNRGPDRGDRGDRGERSDGDRRGRGGPRGRGRGRGRGGFGGYDGRGKRDFDRQSGSDKSGVKPMDKREGGGAHNWGSMKDEVEDQMNPLSEEHPEGADRSGDEALQEPAETRDETEAKEEEVKEPAEDEPKEMTLDEWKREQEGKRSVPKFNLRKPGEGEDSSQWKKLYVLKKKEEDKEQDDEEEESEVSSDDDDFVKRGRQKQLVDIEINFRDSRRGRGRGRGMRGTPSNRGSRGGGGPDRGRGNARSPKSHQQAAPKVDDWNDFPSLATA